MTNGICDWCEREPANPRFREILGIEERRRQGGQNKVIGRTVTGRQICSDCLYKVEHGIPIGQGKLL